MEAAELQLADALHSLREFQLDWTSRRTSLASSTAVAHDAALSIQATRSRICSQLRCLHLALLDIRARIEPATCTGDFDSNGDLYFRSGPYEADASASAASLEEEVTAPDPMDDEAAEYPAASRRIRTDTSDHCAPADPATTPPQLRTACRSATTTAASMSDSADGAESARRSLTLSLALAEQFAHADSSSEDEEAAEDPARLPLSNGVDSRECSETVAMDTDQQHQHHQQHQQHAEIHQCHSWDSQMQQQRQMPRRVAPHERQIIENQRRKVCEEIIETERKYCTCLWTLIDLIGGSLRSASFVSTRDLCLIFPNTLPRLYDVHAAFLASLEESDDCAQRQQPQCSLALAVQQFLLSQERQLLQLYRSYVAQFGAAMRCVRRLRRRSRKFRDLLQSLQRHPDCEGLELTAFLLTPVQRLPRYLLLLRQLADRTNPRHPDLGHLTGATDRLRGLLDQLNCSIQGALAEATAWSGDAPATPTAPTDDEAAASLADRQQHFLLGSGQSSRQRRRSTQPEPLAHHPWDSPRHLKRPQRRDPADRPDLQQQQQRCRSVPPEEASGCGNRVVVFQISPETARRLRPGDRSRSVGDVIAGRGQARRSGSLHHQNQAASAGTAAAAASTAATSAGSATAAGVVGRRRKSSPRTTVKETFRKMFLSRRKVYADSRLDSSWGDL